MRRPYQTVYGAVSAMPVDYDGVLQEIGFGWWQIWNFLLLSIPSATSAMAVFMYDFTAYMPAMRCLVPGCEEENPEYGSFSNFSLPWDGNTVSKCSRYVRNNVSSPNSCAPADFTEVKPFNCHPLARASEDRDLLQLGL